MNKMMELKWLGNKTKQGFYKRTKDAKGKPGKLVLDYKTMEYVPTEKPRFPSVSDARKKTDDGVPAMLKVMFNGTDVAGEISPASTSATTSSMPPTGFRRSATTSSASITP